MFKDRKRSHNLKKVNTIDSSKPHLINYHNYSKELKSYEKVDARLVLFCFYLY